MERRRAASVACVLYSRGPRGARLARVPAGISSNGRWTRPRPSGSRWPPSRGSEVERVLRPAVPSGSLARHLRLRVLRGPVLHPQGPDHADGEHPQRLHAGSAVIANVINFKSSRASAAGSPSSTASTSFTWWTTNLAGLVRIVRAPGLRPSSRPSSVVVLDGVRLERPARRRARIPLSMRILHVRLGLLAVARRRADHVRRGRDGRPGREKKPTFCAGRHYPFLRRPRLSGIAATAASLSTSSSTRRSWPGWSSGPRTRSLSSRSPRSSRPSPASSPPSALG